MYKAKGAKDQTFAPNWLRISQTTYLLTSRDLSPFLFYVRTFPRSGDYSGTSLEMQFIAFLHHIGTQNTAEQSIFPTMPLIRLRYLLPIARQRPQSDLHSMTHVREVLGCNRL